MLYSSYIFISLPTEGNLERVLQIWHYSTKFVLCYSPFIQDFSNLLDISTQEHHLDLTECLK